MKSYTDRIDKPLRLASLLILILIACLAYFDWKALRRTANEARSTGRLLQTVQLILAAMKDAEIGQRGYLLTGSEGYLQPYQAGVAAAPGLLTQLDEQTRRDETETKLARQIRVAVAAKIAELDATIATRRTQGAEAALAIMKTDDGLRTMDEIRTLCKQISEREYRLLIALTDKGERQGIAALEAIAGACVFLLFLLFIIGKIVDRNVSHREKLASELEHACEHLETTVASIGDAVIATDEKGKITLMNPVAQQLTGWTLPDARGRHLDEIFRVVQEDTRAPVESPVAKVLRQKRVAGLTNHTILIAKDGTEKPIDDSGAPIFDSGHNILGVVLIFRDITERRAAELSIEKWKRIFDRAGFGMAVIGSSTDALQEVNEAFALMHGYGSRDELVGKHLSDLMTPDSKMTLPLHLHAVQQKTHYTFESDHIRKDGGIFNCLVDMTEWPEDRETDFARAAYFLDITERKRIQEAISQSEERFRSLADALPQLVWSSQPDGAIDYMNPRWLDYAGGGIPGQMPSDPWTDLLHASDRDEYVRRWQQSLESGEIFEAQSRLKRAADGTYRWFLCRAVPLRDSQNRVVRWMGGCTDVHDQMENSAKLEKAVEALGRSNADLEQFAFAASHDLQEPLRMVAIYTQLLREEYRDKLDDSAKNYIDFAVSGAQRMETLLKDLLSYSRVSNAPATAMKAVDSDQALLTAVVNLEALIRTNDALVSSGPLPCVHLAEFHMVQLFQNLISNAMKYRRKEQPQVHIAAKREGAFWEFSVRDNGLGIDPRYLTQIFGVFKRLHGQEYDGTGIGLAICQRIVERWGGRIWVESEVGVGSTFFFTLPAAD